MKSRLFALSADELAELLSLLNWVHSGYSYELKDDIRFDQPGKDFRVFPDAFNTVQSPKKFRSIKLSDTSSDEALWIYSYVDVDDWNYPEPQYILTPTAVFIESKGQAAAPEFSTLYYTLETLRTIIATYDLESLQV